MNWSSFTGGVFGIQTSHAHPFLASSSPIIASFTT